MKHRIIEDIGEILKSMADLREANADSVEDRVHGFRKSGKRVRGLIDLAYPKHPKSIREFRRNIAEIARTLSHVRDRHVAMRSAKELHALLGGVTLADQPLGDRIGVFLEAETAALERDDASIRTLFNEACARVARASEDWMPLASDHEQGDLQEGLIISYRRGRRAVKGVLNESSHPERFHDLRKATKRLGYQVGWMLEQYDSDLNSHALTLLEEWSKRVGDALGAGLDLRRLGEQLQEWGLQQPGGKESPSLASRVMSDGMSRLVESVPIACRLYYETTRTLRGQIASPRS
jgi:CHAD domain-containing protein